MRSRRSHLPVALGLLLILVVAACGGAASTVLSQVGAPVDGQTGSQGKPAPGSGGDSAGAPEAPGGGQNGQLALKDETKIVRTGSLQLQVDALAPALTRARDSIRAVGGYIGASRESNDGDKSVAQVTYRIPADRWDDALQALRGIATKVLAEQTDALEVTGQLVDLGARIDNLRASETALQAILEKATKISDVLEVQARLTDVRGQIEQLTAQKAHLEDQAGYGTLTVTFGVQVVAVTEAAKGWNAGEEVDRATATLVDVLQSLAGAGIWFGIVWLPILIMLGIVAAVAAVVLRRLGFLRREAPAGPAVV
jgi:hypothetical protein